MYTVLPLSTRILTCYFAFSLLMFSFSVLLSFKLTLVCIDVVNSNIII